MSRFGGPESDECCEEATVLLPMDDVLLDLELGSEVRSRSAWTGGCGDLEGCLE